MQRQEAELGQPPLVYEDVSERGVSYGTLQLEDCHLAHRLFLRAQAGNQFGDIHAIHASSTIAEGGRIGSKNTEIAGASQLPGSARHSVLNFQEDGEICSVQQATTRSPRHPFAVATTALDAKVAASAHVKRVVGVLGRRVAGWRLPRLSRHAARMSKDVDAAGEQHLAAPVLAASLPRLSLFPACCHRCIALHFEPVVRPLCVPVTVPSLATASLLPPTAYRQPRLPQHACRPPQPHTGLPPCTSRRTSLVVPPFTPEETRRAQPTGPPWQIPPTRPP
jgi:hypothetical protein